MKPAPLILIAGSADPARSDYHPPLANAEVAAMAAEQIGAELARQGCRIIVYSSDPSFLERDVVRGFVGTLKKGAQQMVEVRYPHSAPHCAEFPERQLRPELFVPYQDRNASWEAAFYASLRDADGVLIIGGGPSAHAIGSMALAFQVPILPVACFGGAAKAVWLTIRSDVDLPTEQQHQLMNPPAWNEGITAGLVRVLLAQSATRRARREAQEAALSRRTANRHIGAAVCVLFIAIGLTAWGLALPEPHVGPLFTCTLFSVGPLAGAGAALTSSGWRTSGSERPLSATAGLGFVTGLVSSLFYLLAQVSTASDPKMMKSVAVVTAMATGLLGGFTVDHVLRQATDGKLKSLGRL